MISELRVTGLFDRYDYNIPFFYQQGDAITYITGCNGLGKSTILRILHLLFSQQWEQLVLLPFHSFEIVLDGLSIRLLREYPLELQNVDNEDLNARKAKDYALFLEYGMVGEASSRFLIGGYGQEYDPVPSDVSMALEVSGCYYIDDQRLAIIQNSQNSNPVFLRMDQCLATCKQNLRDLKMFVDEKLSIFYMSEYKKITNASPTDKEHYFALYDNLIRWTLLSAKESEHLQQGSSEELNVISTMSILAQEIDGNKQVRDLYNNFVKLEELIASYDYDNKMMQYRLDKGIRFLSTEGQILSCDQLSSGEKQVLIQMYELLFCAPDASVVLVDEPETSQHMGWQMEYYHNIQQISIMKNLQFIVATHLPLMFDDNFRLSVDLYNLTHPADVSA